MTAQRDRLLGQGDLLRVNNGECLLSLQGEEKVLDLMIRNMEEPSLLLLLEQWYAERFGVPGPFEPEETVRTPGISLED